MTYTDRVEKTMQMNQKATDAYVRNAMNVEAGIDNHGYVEVKRGLPALFDKSNENRELHLWDGVV